MKKLRLGFVVGLLLVLAFAAVPGASAQGGITGYSTGVQVQNLGSAIATVDITFYNQDGSTGGTLSGEKIDAGASKTYFPIQSVSQGFNGSAVVSADQPVAAIVNLLGANNTYAGSANGISTASTTVGLPLIMRGNSGFNTWFNVQNAGSTDAHVSIAYVPGSSGTASTETKTIKPGAAATFDQNTNTALGTKFVGSATVTSDVPIVAVVNQVGTGTSKALLSYDGFAAGSTTVAAPLIMALNSGFFTGISVQNIGSASTNVTITYGPNTGGTLAPAADTFTLTAGQGQAVLQSGGKWTSKYVGSALITADQPLVAIVNQLNGNLGTAYEGFAIGTALTTKVSVPLIMANNGGYFTGIQCANAGSSSTDITFTYTANTAGTFAPAAETKTVAAGASVTVLQNGGAWGTNKYIGGATITSSASNIVCIANELKPGTTDTFLTYDGINY